MDKRLTEARRRRLLALVGSGFATGLAGCSGGGDGDGGGDDGGATATATETETETEGGDGGGGDGGGGENGVPSEYETAESLGGTERDPDSLSSKEAVDYQDEPKNGNQCSDCQFYIEDMNGDGMGACAIVAGQIAPEGWCASYSAYQG